MNNILGSVIKQRQGVDCVIKNTSMSLGKVTKQSHLFSWIGNMEWRLMKPLPSSLSYGAHSHTCNRSHTSQDKRTPAICSQDTHACVCTHTCTHTSTPLESLVILYRSEFQQIHNIFPPQSSCTRGFHSPVFITHQFFMIFHSCSPSPSSAKYWLKCCHYKGAPGPDQYF